MGNILVIMKIDKVQMLVDRPAELKEFVFSLFTPSDKSNTNLRGPYNLEEAILPKVPTEEVKSLKMKD